MERRSQILNWLKNILDSNLSGIKFKAFIFGSQANQAILKRSDIDLGINADTEIPLNRMAKIVADIENLPMLFTVDVVDFYNVDEKFKTVALSNIEKL